MSRRPRGWKVWTDHSGQNWRCRWIGKYGTGQETFLYKTDAGQLADNKRRDFLRLDAGLSPLPRTQIDLTVRAWADKYLTTSKREKGARTYNNFDRPAVESFVEHHGDLILSIVSDEHVRAWKEKIQDRYGATTALMRFRALRTFFNAAVKSGIIPHSPARLVRRPPDGPEGRAMRDEELMALMAVAPEALYRAGTFALNTFCRINEVVAFDWAWVTELPGGGWIGRIPRENRKTRSKTKFDCWFPINPEAKAVMGPRRLSGRVFPWAANTIQQQMTKARADAKLPEGLSFHSFRHTAASRYLALTGHMEDLLKSHVWDDPRSLLRYVTLDPQTLYNRFAGLQNPFPAPTWLPKSKPPGA